MPAPKIVRRRHTFTLSMLRDAHAAMFTPFACHARCANDNAVATTAFAPASSASFVFFLRRYRFAAATHDAGS